MRTPVISVWLVILIALFTIFFFFTIIANNPLFDIISVQCFLYRKNLWSCWNHSLVLYLKCRCCHILKILFNMSYAWFKKKKFQCFFAASTYRNAHQSLWEQQWLWENKALGSELIVSNALPNSLHTFLCVSTAPYWKLREKDVLFQLQVPVEGTVRKGKKITDFANATIWLAGLLCTLTLECGGFRSCVKWWRFQIFLKFREKI